MCFDQIYSYSFSTVSSTLPFLSPNFIYSFKKEPGSPFTVACMNMCVRPSSMIASTSWISEDWICLPHKHHLPISPQIGWGFTIPSPIHDGFLSSLILCRSCICSHSFFEFMCAIALQWPENNILLLKSAVFFALAFFLLSQQCLGLGVFDFFFVCWPALGLYNNHHWLQKEDFL